MIVIYRKMGPLDQLFSPHSFSQNGLRIGAQSHIYTLYQNLWFPLTLIYTTGHTFLHSSSASPSLRTQRFQATSSQAA